MVASFLEKYLVNYAVEVESRDECIDVSINAHLQRNLLSGIFLLHMIFFL